MSILRSPCFIATLEVSPVQPLLGMARLPAGSRCRQHSPKNCDQVTAQAVCRHHRHHRVHSPPAGAKAGRRVANLAAEVRSGGDNDGEHVSLLRQLPCLHTHRRHLAGD